MKQTGRKLTLLLEKKQSKAGKNSRRETNKTTEGFISTPTTQSAQQGSHWRSPAKTTGTSVVQKRKITTITMRPLIAAQ